MASEAAVLCNSTYASMNVARGAQVDIRVRLKTRVRVQTRVRVRTAPHSYLSRPHRVSRVPENALGCLIAQIEALPRRIEIPGKKFSKKNFVDGDVVDKFST